MWNLHHCEYYWFVHKMMMMCEHALWNHKVWNDNVWVFALHSPVYAHQTLLTEESPVPGWSVRETTQQVSVTLRNNKVVYKLQHCSQDTKTFWEGTQHCNRPTLVTEGQWLQGINWSYNSVTCCNINLLPVTHAVKYHVLSRTVWVEGTHCCTV